MIKGTLDAGKSEIEVSFKLPDTSRAAPYEVTYVHDEAMGYCAHHNGHTVLAANLDIRYRAATPLLQPLTLRASIHQVSGRKVIAKSRMFVEALGCPFVGGALVAKWQTVAP